MEDTGFFITWSTKRIAIEIPIGQYTLTFLYFFLQILTREIQNKHENS